MEKAQACCRLGEGVTSELIMCRGGGCKFETGGGESLAVWSCRREPLSTQCKLGDFFCLNKRMYILAAVLLKEMKIKNPNMKFQYGKLKV